MTLIEMDVDSMNFEVNLFIFVLKKKMVLCSTIFHFHLANKKTERKKEKNGRKSYVKCKKDNFFSSHFFFFNNPFINWWIFIMDTKKGYQIQQSDTKNTKRKTPFFCIYQLKSNYKALYTFSFLYYVVNIFT